MCKVCRQSSSPPHCHHLFPPPSNGIERWPLPPWNMLPSHIHAASSSSSLLVTRHESSTSHSSLQEHALLLTTRVLEPRLASVPLMLATASVSSLITDTSSLLLLLPLPRRHQRSVSPPPLSLGLVVPLSAASSYQPQNSRVVFQQTIAPTRLCLFWWLIVVFFYAFFQSLNCQINGTVFFAPPSPLLQSHSPIMVSADDAWSLPPSIPAPSLLGRSGRPPQPIIVDFLLHPQQQNSQQVVQKIPRHRSGRCSSLISQNGRSID
jgi:hypothetical protein